MSEVEAEVLRSHLARQHDTLLTGPFDADEWLVIHDGYHDNGEAAPESWSNPHPRNDLTDIYDVEYSVELADFPSPDEAAKQALRLIREGISLEFTVQSKTTQQVFNIDLTDPARNLEQHRRDCIAWHCDRVELEDLENTDVPPDARDWQRSDDEGTKLLRSMGAALDWIHLLEEG